MSNKFSILVLVALACGFFFFKSQKTTPPPKAVENASYTEEKKVQAPEAKTEIEMSRSNVVKAEDVKAEIKKEVEDARSLIEADKRSRLAQLSPEERTELSNEEDRLRKEAEVARKEEQEKFERVRKAAVLEETKRYNESNKGMSKTPQG